MVVDQYGLTDTATVQVTITDINNNTPSFSQSVYSAELYGEPGADPGGGGPGARAPPLTLGFEAPKLSIFGPYLIFP